MTALDSNFEERVQVRGHAARLIAGVYVQVDGLDELIPVSVRVAVSWRGVALEMNVDDVAQEIRDREVEGQTTFLGRSVPDPDELDGEVVT